MTVKPLAFTGHDLDRDDHTRADPARLAEMRSRADALLLKLDGIAPCFDGEALAFAPLVDVPEDAPLAYLGLRAGKPIFVQLVDEGDNRPAMAMRPVLFQLVALSAAEVALYGGARSLVDWHARHRFCARCGQPTQVAKGGWQRDCPACEAQHFPRTDPVAITLIEHDDALLLGRGKGWPERAYSTLAGFVEPGESIEEGVVREVLEEVGLHVRDVSYIASQPWPFPSQLMIGCHCHADSRDLTVDETELADASWFTRAEVAHVMAGGEGRFIAPPPFAIAHHLLRYWLEKRA